MLSLCNVMSSCHHSVATITKLRCSFSSLYSPSTLHRNQIAYLYSVEVLIWPCCYVSCFEFVADLICASRVCSFVRSVKSSFSVVEVFGDTYRVLTLIHIKISNNYSKYKKKLSLCTSLSKQICDKEISIDGDCCQIFSKVSVQLLHVVFL